MRERLQVKIGSSQAVGWAGRHVSTWEVAGQAGRSGGVRKGNQASRLPRRHVGAQAGSAQAGSAQAGGQADRQAGKCA